MIYWGKNGDGKVGLGDVVVTRHRAAGVKCDALEGKHPESILGVVERQEGMVID